MDTFFIVCRIGPISKVEEYLIVSGRPQGWRMAVRPDNLFLSESVARAASVQIPQSYVRRVNYELGDTLA